MSELLFKKKIDQSVLKDGFTVIKEYEDIIQKKLNMYLEKGEAKDIQVKIGEKSYRARLYNVNFNENNTSKKSIQVRYSDGSDICKCLNSVFESTSNLIKSLKKDGKKVAIDDVDAEWMDVCVIGEGQLELVCYPKTPDILHSFIDYIGPIDSFVGYQCSYNLVFYKTFFERYIKKENQNIEDFASQFLKFYQDRFSEGKVTDIGVVDIIANPVDTTNKQVLDLIKRNPYDKIHNKGYFAIENEEFTMNEQLSSLVTAEEAQKILQLVNLKIENYYATKVDINAELLKPLFERFMDGYHKAKEETFAGSEFGTFVRKEIPEKIFQTGIVSKEKYVINGSVGQGNWAAVPWIGVFDKEITTSATKGVYIVYLLSNDTNSLYLTFNQGCTEIRNHHSKKETITIMREKALAIASVIDDRGFNTDEDINLGKNISDLGEMYQKGTIFYKEYKKGAVPSEGELQSDLRNMIDIYREYVANIQADNEEEAKEGEEQLDIKETLERIKIYISSKGFTFDDGLIENYYLSLKSKPFVILAGTSGTGKTRLVRLFAEAIGATVQNGRYKLVSVRPDWSDSSDLFGHVDLNGKFIPGAIIDFVKEAEANKELPYFLCLDEMNLARVEYYLSDILSIIETRELVNGEVVTDPLLSENYYGADEEAKAYYGEVRIPENLYIIGTVNMDETTFPFSKKVLDRANTIEFSTVDFNLSFEEAEEVEATEANNSFMKAEYVLLKQCLVNMDLVQKVSGQLQAINKILEKANAHVGYRVRDEIVFYMLNNDGAELLSFDEALDNEIMQKILPRIQGSNVSVKNMLCDLFKVCAGNYEGYQTEDENISSKMFGVIKNQKCKYVHSAEKIAYMVRRFEEDGFTAYWL